MHFKIFLKMLFLVLALPKLNIGTKNQYEIFHVHFLLTIIIICSYIASYMSLVVALLDNRVFDKVLTS